jgi:DNA polymerase III subunit delta
MVIFLYGPDGFRAREKMKNLKERFIKEVDKSGLNLMDLDGANLTINDLNKAIATQSFLSNKRMVIIRNIFKAKKAMQTETLEFLKEKEIRDGKDDNVVIFLDEEPDRRAGLFKYLAGAKYTEEFQVLKPNEIMEWIIKRVAERGGRISGQNAFYLASKSDGNLWALSGEVDKILARKGGEIAKEDIDEAEMVKIDNNVFNLTDALANKNKKLALQLINDQLEAGADEFYLFSMMVRQFRIIIQIRSVLDEGKKVVAKDLGLHPFVAQKGIEQARKYNMEQLKDIYRKLLEIDIKMKTSDIPGKALMEIFAAEG